MSSILRFSGDYSFLSNFYPVEVVYSHWLYRSVEHAYQASKTRIEFERQRIAQCPTPGEAKRAGKRVTLREDWSDELKLEIMHGLLRQKFKQEPFHSKLMATGERDLVEGNYWGDTFWGVCRGKGQNHLGKLLMQVRTELRQ